MKKLWILSMLCMALVGCQPATESHVKELQEQEQQIEVMKEEIGRLKHDLASKTAQMDDLQEELESARQALADQEQLDDLFPMLANQALAFVRAHTSGDLKALQPLVSEDIQLEYEGRDLVASWHEDTQLIEWTLWEEKSDRVYQDMVIQGYGQLPDGRLLIHIREFYTREGDPLSPPTFLTLFYREEPDGWIVSCFEFDV